VTEEEQAEAVEGALSGQAQCAECKKWLDPSLMQVVASWPIDTCALCWHKGKKHAWFPGLYD
jgi:hypothetical protein